MSQERRTSIATPSLDTKQSKVKYGMLVWLQTRGHRELQTMCVEPRNTCMAEMMASNVQWLIFQKKNEILMISWSHEEQIFFVGDLGVLADRARVVWSTRVVGSHGWLARSTHCFYTFGYQRYSRYECARFFDGVRGHTKQWSRNMSVILLTWLIVFAVHGFHRRQNCILKGQIASQFVGGKCRARVSAGDLSWRSHQHRVNYAWRPFLTEIWAALTSAPTTSATLNCVWTQQIRQPLVDDIVLARIQRSHESETAQYRHTRNGFGAVLCINSDAHDSLHDQLQALDEKQSGRLGRPAPFELQFECGVGTGKCVAASCPSEATTLERCRQWPS